MISILLLKFLEGSATLIASIYIRRFYWLYLCGFHIISTHINKNHLRNIEIVMLNIDFIESNRRWKFVASFNSMHTPKKEQSSMWISMILVRLFLATISTKHCSKVSENVTKNTTCSKSIVSFRSWARPLTRTPANI